MKIKFIINPVAGKSRAKKSGTLIKSILFENHDISISETQGPKHAVSLAKEAAELGYDAVIAVGGDGTISEVMNGLMGTTCALGIIPSGSGNDFAKTVGIPMDPQEALKIILGHHEIKPIDIGKLNDKYFLNVSGIGIDVEVLRHFEKMRQLIPGSLGYNLSVLKALITYRYEPIEIYIDDTRIDRDVLLLSIGNGQYMGGGMKITPDARIDDGLLNICVVDKMPKLKILTLFPTIFKGNHVRYKEVESFTAKKVTINTPDKVINCDGELTVTTPVTLTIAKEKLNFIFPK